MGLSHSRNLFKNVRNHPRFQNCHPNSLSAFCYLLIFKKQARKRKRHCSFFIRIYIVRYRTDNRYLDRDTLFFQTINSAL